MSSLALHRGGDALDLLEHVGTLVEAGQHDGDVGSRARAAGAVLDRVGRVAGPCAGGRRVVAATGQLTGPDRDLLGGGGVQGVVVRVRGAGGAAWGCSFIAREPTGGDRGSARRAGAGRGPGRCGAARPIEPIHTATAVTALGWLDAATAASPGRENDGVPTIPDTAAALAAGALALAAAGGPRSAAGAAPAACATPGPTTAIAKLLECVDLAGCPRAPGRVPGDRRRERRHPGVRVPPATTSPPPTSWRGCEAAGWNVTQQAVRVPARSCRCRRRSSSRCPPPAGAAHQHDHVLLGQRRRDRRRSQL